MSTDTKVVVGGGSGIGFLSLLALLFIGLKLGHVIEWSWLWITCPLWIPLAIWACFLLFGLSMFIIAAILKR